MNDEDDQSSFIVTHVTHATSPPPLSPAPRGGEPEPSVHFGWQSHPKCTDKQFLPFSPVAGCPLGAKGQGMRG